MHVNPSYRHFWAHDPGPQLLASLHQSPAPQCWAVADWNKGGCLVAALALQQWLRISWVARPGELSVSLVAVATDETEAAHVLVQVQWTDALCFVDTQGVWTAQELIERLADTYRDDDYALVPWTQVTYEQVRIPRDDQVVCLVAEALTSRLGACDPTFLGVSWLRLTPVCGEDPDVFDTGIAKSELACSVESRLQVKQ